MKGDGAGDVLKKRAEVNSSDCDSCAPVESIKMPIYWTNAKSSPASIAFNSNRLNMNYLCLLFSYRNEDRSLCGHQLGAGCRLCRRRRRSGAEWRRCRTTPAAQSVRLWLHGVLDLHHQVTRSSSSLLEPPHWISSILALKSSVIRWKPLRGDQPAPLPPKRTPVTRFLSRDQYH